MICVAKHRGEWDSIEGGNPGPELKSKDFRLIKYICITERYQARHKKLIEQSPVPLHARTKPIVNIYYYARVIIYLYKILRELFLTHIVPKIQNIYFQKWNCVASFPISTSVSDLYVSWSVLGSLIAGIQYINCSQMHGCGSLETEHYNSVLEIRRLPSFISGNT